jgi:hypothetical protein
MRSANSAGSAVKVFIRLIRYHSGLFGIIASKRESSTGIRGFVKRNEK